MDANGTRYHLLLGERDWSGCLAPNLAWDAERQHLTLEPLVYFYVASPADSAPKIDDRRGAARDRFGNWYWIDSTKQVIRVLSAGSRQATDFWPLEQPASCPPEPAPASFQPVSTPAPDAPLTFGGLAVTEGHYLIVGVLNPAGLLVFDLLGGGSPSQYTWPADVPFAPFDMSPMPGGGVWILDRKNKRYWALDGHFAVIGKEQQIEPPAADVEETFQPASGEKRIRPQARFPRGITLADAMPLVERDPIAIEALPDCTVLILDRVPGAKFSFVSRYRYATRLGNPVSTEIMKSHVEQDQQDKFELVAHDFVFVSEHSVENEVYCDRLYIVSSGGNQTFAFTIEGDDSELKLHPIADEYYPMRLYSGKALVAAGSDVYYDMGERWLPLMRQNKPRYRLEGTFTRIFDGKEPGCTWHRLLLDACIPTDTEVLIWSRAADTQGELPGVAWQAERIYRRGDGSELPYAPNPFAALKADGTRQAAPEGSGTWEALFQVAVGRYVELRVTLRGQGQRTPRLRAMRLYYPRFSYLQNYLPAAYRQDRQSASFLDRFLANTEGTFTALEDKIAAVRLLFDVRSAPPEVLDWLADWFGIALDPTWDEYRRRLFIQNAMVFFQYRGTPRGLCMALHLAMDAYPTQKIFDSPGCCDMQYPGQLRIVESFRARKFPSVMLGDPSQLEPDEKKGGWWVPKLGRGILNQQWQAGSGEKDFPLTDPGGAKSQSWRNFSLSALGFVPSLKTTDWALWQAFLLRTYGGVTAYNTAWKESQTSLDLVKVPLTLPADGAPLNDWWRFETEFLPLARNAHHFSVLLPVSGNVSVDSPEYQSRLVLAKRVLELEKPAHTTYDLRFFWSLFRVGEVRLGMDTLLDQGGRSANLLSALVVGQGFLAQGYLSPENSLDFPDRLRLGKGCDSNFIDEESAPAPVFTPKPAISPARRSGCYPRRSS